MKHNRYDINYFKDLAIKKGGICLSNNYLTIRHKLEWKCINGHIFFLEPNKIFNRGYWCAECTGRRKKHTIETIQKITQKRGWLFLSDEFTVGEKKYKFQCEKGHIIYAIAHNVIKGAGCRTCAGKQLLSIDLFKQIAINKGGECLSEHYNGQKTKLKFRCKEGHIFETMPGEIKNGGAWCKKCAGLELGTIEEMITLATSNGGECLSNKYINNTTKLKWKCADNHIWEATPRDVKHSKSWCPYCTWYRDESKCRHILERLLNTEFRKTRKVLQNGLELDGYSKELGIAFEYNGKQHYEKSYFSNSIEKLEKIKKSDQIKIDECKSKGIQAFNRNGKCLSIEYVNNSTNLLWECNKSHQWLAQPQSIKNKKTWCPFCARLRMEKGRT